MRAEGIGVNVHYLPVHLHPYYQNKFGTGRGLCPVAEAAYERILSLPMFPAMTDDDVRDVVEAVDKVISHYHDENSEVGAAWPLREMMTIFAFKRCGSYQ